MRNDILAENGIAKGAWKLMFTCPDCSTAVFENAVPTLDSGSGAISGIHSNLNIGDGVITAAPEESSRATRNCITIIESL